MACESLVSQVQHPSNQALKQAVTTNCQLSKVIPLHLTIALAAASACTHARRQVCLRKRVQKKTSMRHRKTYSQCAAGAERYCMLCRQRHFAHMHVHAPHCSRACWPSCGRAKKRQLTKNSSHCDRSTDIYSLVAQSCPAAYSCVCACHNRKSKLFPPACSFNKDRLVCENVAECPTLGGCYDNHKSLETRKQTARLLRGS